MRPLPNSSNFSILMLEALGCSMKNRILLKKEKDGSRRASIFGALITKLGGDKTKIKDVVHDLTPEI